MKVKDSRDDLSQCGCDTCVMKDKTSNSVQACSDLAHVVLVLVGVRRVTVVHIGLEGVLVVIHFCVAILFVNCCIRRCSLYTLRFKGAFVTQDELVGTLVLVDVELLVQSWVRLRITWKDSKMLLATLLLFGPAFQLRIERRFWSLSSPLLFALTIPSNGLVSFICLLWVQMAPRLRGHVSLAPVRWLSNPRLFERTLLEFRFKLENYLTPVNEK